MENIPIGLFEELEVPEAASLVLDNIPRGVLEAVGLEKDPSVIDVPAVDATPSGAALSPHLDLLVTGVISGASFLVV